MQTSPALCLFAALALTLPLAHTAAGQQTSVLTKDVLEQLVERCDANRDGKLDANERERLRELLSQRRASGEQGSLPGLPFLPRRKVVAKFDRNGNRRLESSERERARRWLMSEGGSVWDRIPVGDARPLTDRQEAPTARRIKPGDVPHHPGIELYDAKILRTVFLTFPKDDWLDELSTFYLTDVELPASLTVDGRVYSDVGVRFRGRASFLTSPGRKKSFRITLDFANKGQDLLGYETLNLVNGQDDPSFLREVMYSRICREYIPAAQANLVRLVINGESWGVYVNVQQIDKKFLQQQFGTLKGARWKVVSSLGNTGALTWLGGDSRRYRKAYQLKTGAKKKKARKELVRLCRALKEVPKAELSTKLPELLDIEHALWFLALENVFMDGDGYSGSGGDYYLYVDPKERFHLFPYDNDRTFRVGVPADGPARRRERGRSRRLPNLSPLGHLGTGPRPLLSRLLEVPEWRARYLAYVRTIAEQWLDWSTLGPQFDGYRKLIDAEVKQDDKSVHGYDAFAGSFATGGPESSLRSFVEERRKYLLTHSALSEPRPVITSVEHQETSAPEGRRKLVVLARVGTEIKLDAVVLHFGRGARGPYRTTPMFDDGQHGDGAAGDRVFGGSPPALMPGKRVRYFVEARGAGSTVTTFRPTRAGAGAIMHRFRKE